MYEKFKTRKYYLLNDKLYFDNQYFVEKVVFETYLYHGLYRKFLRFETGLGAVLKTGKKNKTGIGVLPFLEENTLEQKKERYFTEECIRYRAYVNNKGQEDIPYFNNQDEYRYMIDEYDLAEELNTYCPNPKKKQLYFYKKVFYKDKELPLFFTVLSSDLLWDKYKNLSLNKQNWKRYNELIDSKIQYFIDESIIQPKSLTWYNEFEKILADLYRKYYDYKDEEKSYLNIACNYRDYVKKDDLFITWMTKVIHSLCYEVIPGFAYICEHCGHRMQYARGKKYCSLKIDGKNCAKSARNKTTYANNKKSI